MFNDSEGSILIEDPSGNTYHMDGQGNIKVSAPKNISFTAGQNINISAGQNITTTAGMNISASAGMNYTQIVGVNFVSTVAGNANHFISGTLTELIEGDVHDEVMKGKTTVNNDGGIEYFSETTISRSAEKEIQNNSGEKSKLF